MPGDLYSADRLIGKTLIAAKPVAVYHTPNDHALSFGTVAAGQPVGVVYSYLAPNLSYYRSTLWWAYKDAFGGDYYSKMEAGLYNISALQEQGVLTVEDEIKKEQDANKTWYEKLLDTYGPPLLVTGVAVALGTAVIKGFFSRSKS